MEKWLLYTSKVQAAGSAGISDTDIENPICLLTSEHCSFTSPQGAILKALRKYLRSLPISFFVELTRWNIEL